VHGCWKLGLLASIGRRGKIRPQVCGGATMIVLWEGREASDMLEVRVAGCGAGRSQGAM